MKPSTPMTGNQVDAYAGAHRALEVVESLAQRIEMRLRDGGRTAEWLDAEELVGDDDFLNKLIIRVKIGPETPTAWWQNHGASAEFWVLPFEPNGDPRADEPQLWTGIVFDESAIVTPAVRSACDRGGLVPDEDDNGAIMSAGFTTPLRDLLGDGAELQAQADRAAAWVQARLSAIDALES